jgi:hypothetical protein
LTSFHDLPDNPIFVVHFMPKALPLVSGHLPFISFSLIIMFNVCGLLAYSTRSQWWGCHLILWAGWFSVRVSSPSLWSSPFATRQWCWFWSTLGILFLQSPPYLVRFPLSATWGAPNGRSSTPYRLHYQCSTQTTVETFKWNKQLFR